MKDLKYLLAYITPLLFLIGLYFQGWLIWSTIIFGYILVPIIDHAGVASTANLDEAERQNKLVNRLFDWMLYFNLPLVYLSITGSIYVLSHYSLATYETVGIVMSLGFVLSTMGINVGHELGHRSTRFETTISKLLYLPSHYIHFFIEHNRGHHKNVSTPLDPATAKKNQSLYSFWIQSVTGGYKGAWSIENNRLKTEGKALKSWNNQMVRFTIYQVAYWAILYTITTPFIASLVLISGVISFLLLETINYVEHYGLQRKLLPSGRYERVQARHSWNANYPFGRILLYELTRHSDHHFIASKKYQILDHHEEAPELPYGYPMSVILSTIPPIWYKVMNDRIPSA